MEFVEEIVEKVVGPSDYGSSSAPPAYEGPPLPPPWIARWESEYQRWIYINEQTGERTWERPSYGYGAPPPQQYGGYGGQQPYGGSYGPPQEYRSESYQQEYVSEEPKRDHSWAYGAAGAAAGLVGGAILMHEGEKIHEKWEEDKDRIENDIENFPQNAAEWTGEKVGEVERIPQDIENGIERAEDRVEQGFDNAVQDVENFPENAAGWVGEKVGEVERFGDEVENYGESIENAYDQGVAEGRGDYY